MTQTDDNELKLFLLELKETVKNDPKSAAQQISAALLLLERTIEDKNMNETRNEAFKRECPGYAKSIDDYCDGDSLGTTDHNAKALDYRQAFYHGYDAGYQDAQSTVQIVTCPKCKKKINVGDKDITVWINTHLSGKCAGASAQPSPWDLIMERAWNFKIPFNEEVYIAVYPRSRKSILHYRDREGDWLTDLTNDADFTGNRKWKEFASPIEAFTWLKEYLKTDPSPSGSTDRTEREGL